MARSLLSTKSQTLRQKYRYHSLYRSVAYLSSKHRVFHQL